MSRLKLSLSTTCYYLKVVGSKGDEMVTTAKDIVMREGEFQFQMTEPIELLEIWNYDRCCKVATILLNNNPLTEPFNYACLKHNLDLHFCKPSPVDEDKLRASCHSTDEDSDSQ